jgi:hypothetical protein
MPVVPPMLVVCGDGPLSVLFMAAGRRVLHAWQRVMVIVRRLSGRGRVHSWAPLHQRCVDTNCGVLLTIDSFPALLTVPISALMTSMVSGITIDWLSTMYASKSLDQFPLRVGGRQAGCETRHTIGRVDR